MVPSQTRSPSNGFGEEKSGVVTTFESRSRVVEVEEENNDDDELFPYSVTHKSIPISHPHRDDADFDEFSYISDDIHQQLSDFEHRIKLEDFIEGEKRLEKDISKYTEIENKGDTTGYNARILEGRAVDREMLEKNRR